MHTLYWSGAVGKIEHGVKLLADVSAVKRFGRGAVSHRNDVVVKSFPDVWVFASRMEPAGDTLTCVMQSKQVDGSLVAHTNT